MRVVAGGATTTNKSGGLAAGTLLFANRAVGSAALPGPTSIDGPPGRYPRDVQQDCPLPPM